MLLEYYHNIDYAAKLSDNGKLLDVDEKGIRQIVDLFAKQAVYERQNWEPIFGKEAIRRFFSEERPLNGIHHIDEKSIEEKDGLDSRIARKVLSCFPELVSDQCTTVIVKGHFDGNYNVTESGQNPRFVRTSTHVSLSFIDYWVTNSQCVIYRYSVITQLKNNSITKRDNCIETYRF